MKKSDLVSGRHVVENKGGVRYLFLGDVFMRIGNSVRLGEFFDNLTHIEANVLSIDKIYEVIDYCEGFREILEDVQCLDLVWERNPELSEKEGTIEVDIKNKDLLRLTKLGKALEIAYSKGALLIYDIEKNYDDEIIRYNADENLEDVLEWGDY